MSDDDFLPTEQPRLTIDEMAPWLAQRYATGERDGPVVEDLRLYVAARVEQGWDYDSIIRQVAGWKGLTDRYVTRLLESLATTGTSPEKHDEVWYVDGVLVFKESTAATRLTQRREKFLRQARMLAQGGRLGDDT